MTDVPGFFADKMKQAREAAGLSKYRIAQLTGLSQPYVGGLEAGRNLPSSAALAKLAPALGVSLETMQAWVDTDRIGEDGMKRLAALAREPDRYGDDDHTKKKLGKYDGSMVSAPLPPETKKARGVKDSEQNNPEQRLSDTLRPVPGSGLVRLPVFGIVSCGDPAWMPETALDFIDIPTALARDAEAAIQVRGSSMVGCGFFDGDYLYVRRLDGEKPASGKIVVACVDGEYTCVVYRRDELGEYLEKRPDFGEAKRYPIHDETRIHALVVAHTRFM